MFVEADLELSASMLLFIFLLARWDDKVVHDLLVLVI